MVRGMMVVCACISTSGRNLGSREGRAQAHRHKDIEDLVGHSGDERFYGSGEEFWERESLGGIASERIGRLRGVEVGEDGLVEAQVGPARKEAKDGEKERRERQERREREDEHYAEIEERKSGDAQGDDASEQGDGMRWDELAEGDKETDLDRNRAGDRGQAT